MRRFKFLWCPLFLVLTILLSACRTMPAAGRVDVANSSPELLDTAYLYKIVRYLYRWQLDEAEVAGAVGANKFIFWVRGLSPQLDPADRSQFGEIALPQLGLTVRVKKADYILEELGTEVKSQNFRITQVSRGPLPDHPPRSWTVVEVDMKEMQDFLFSTRSQREYPDPVLVERLRQALRKEAAKEGILSAITSTGEKIVHLAPLSPVANETWAFWEEGRKLFYFSSDIDLANPAVWEHQSLMVRIYNLDEQVVVSHEEAPGSGRFLTRFQVGRILFNCVLLGQRITVPPYVAPSKADPEAARPRP